LTRHHTQKRLKKGHPFWEEAFFLEPRGVCAFGSRLHAGLCKSRWWPLWFNSSKVLEIGQTAEQHQVESMKIPVVLATFSGEPVGLTLLLVDWPSWQ